MQARLDRGFTLIEVLMALFVLAVGVAGAAAAQLAAERTRQQSALMSEAAQLASSLAARMQANPPVARLPDGANPYLSFSYDALSDGAPGAAAGACFAAACDPLQLAEFDLHEMRLALHERFPGGRIAVCRDGAPWDESQERYRWECTDASDAPAVAKLGWLGNGEAPALVAMVAP